VSEHFGAFLTDADPTVPDGAYLTVQVAAALTALTVVTGVVIALPTLVHFLSRGGWQRIRRPLGRACVVSLLAVAATVVLVAWAHGLTTAERNGSDIAYSLAFLAWAVLVMLAIASWTVAGVVAGRHLTLRRNTLRAERALATLATTGMLVIVVAVAAWSLAMASQAGSFFSGPMAGPTPAARCVPPADGRGARLGDRGCRDDVARTTHPLFLRVVRRNARISARSA